MADDAHSDLADRLRAQPTLTGVAPPLDVQALPSDPVALFVEWLDLAISDGVAEPHAAVLATVDADGVPDARTLILKDVDARGWAFASTRSSRKGAQLSAHPVAALSFWWPSQVRAVRVRGRVVEASAEESAADFARRSAAARDGVTEGDWTLWRLQPARIEFWQGAADRNHTRIVFERGPDGTLVRARSEEKTA
ncbi:MAG: pyridoxamine 5'-phosphate oxidase family protein [Microbacterium sp.]|nr:pyridoxamine 5'-phosphate oxidase family protein [Microbacterium sp.]